jgi:hypothetical protein
MKIDKSFILREIAGDYVIVPTGETALQFNGLITVNEVGAFLWEKLQEEITEQELVEAVLAEYEVDADTAKKDVSEFLDYLVKGSILEK